MRSWMKAAVLMWMYASVTTIACAQDATAYLNASEELQRLSLLATPESGMPRMSDKKVAALISTLSNSRLFLDSAPYQLKDLSVLMDICGKSNAAVMSYMLFDLKNNIDPNGDPNLSALQMQKVVIKNAHTFQDELEQLQPFSLRCGAKMNPLLTEFLLSLTPEELTDIRLAGLKQTQNGTMNSLFGVLLMSNDPTLKISYRSLMLQAASEAAASNATILPLTARRKIVELAKSAQPNAPEEFHNALEGIVDAMSDTRCEGMCRF